MSKDILTAIIFVIYRLSRFMGYARFLRFFFVAPKPASGEVCEVCTSTGYGAIGAGVPGSAATGVNDLAT